MLIVRGEDLKSLRKVEKIRGVKEMTGLSNPGLLSFVQGPALLISILLAL